jgi:hypothetical protein
MQLGAAISGVFSTPSAWTTFQSYFPGVPNKCFTTYLDKTQNSSNWANYVGNYLASSCASFDPTMIPMVGWGLGTTPEGALFSQISAGNYDSAMQAGVQGFATNGFSQVIFRLGWEMNLNWPWAVTSTNASAWVAAWQHMANVLHAAGTTYGIKVLTNWCPARGVNQNDGTCTIAQMYPGDTYVDQYGIDMYDAPIDGTLPGTSGSSTAYEFVTMLSLAAAAGKPWSIGEMGITTTTYANALVNTIHSSRPAGSKCAFINFWDQDTDGDYLFADNPTVYPILQAAFGAAGSVTNP